MMARYCTQCGKETGGGGYCIHCGAPVAGSPEPASGQEEGVPPHRRSRKKKRGGLSVLAFIAGGLLLMALIVVGVVFLFNPFHQPVEITYAYTTTDPVEDASPTPMDFYTPVTGTINLYGEADHLTQDTIIELLWLDETDGGTELGRTMATVDAGAGVFYSTYQMPTGNTFRLAFSGQYRVDVLVNGEETPAYAVSFEVFSMPRPPVADAPINDIYMVALEPDGSYRPVAEYPAGTDEMTALVSFSAMEEGATWKFRWLYREAGEWGEIEGDAADFQPVTEDPVPGLYAHSVSASSGAWLPGEYRLEVYLSGNEDTPYAVAEYTVVGGETASPVLQEIVMTTGLDDTGAPVDEVTEYPYGTRSFICSFYFQGAGEQPLAWEWHDQNGLMDLRQEELITEDGYYWIKYNQTDTTSFAPGEYTLFFYLPEQGDAPVAQVSFSVVETSTVTMADLDEGSISLTQDAWADWNGWLKTFTEGRLVPFGEELPSDSDLIDFGVLYNYFYNEDMYATLDEYGVCWLDASALDYTLWWFLDTGVTPASTGQVIYEGDSYGYKAPEEAPPYMFPQVRGIYAHGDEGFILEFDVYTAPVGFADFNGDYDSWEDTGAVPEYVGGMRAWVVWASDGDTDRRVLKSYEWME